MKKMISLLLAALLVCVSGAALAETPAEASAIDTFEHLWVNEADEDDTLEIWYDEDEWQLLAMWIAGDDIYSVLFDRCVYDGAQKALICEGGVLWRDSMLDFEEDVPDAEMTVVLTSEGENPIEIEVGMEPLEEVEEAPEEIDLGEEAASGFGAVLTVDENGLLHWTGSGDAVADRVYINWDGEDDGLFVGEWTSDSVEISVSLRQGVYDVFAMRVGENEAAYWDYFCALDETGALVGVGSKSVVVFDENGDFTETVAYEDGAASFTLEDGNLVWNDARENAGAGLIFIREPEE